MSEKPVTKRTIRLGTRGSMLARWQADWAAARLIELGATVEIVEITTAGDTNLAPQLSEIGSVGVFTKEIQSALLDRTVDIAVHSLKDLPTVQVPELLIAAVPSREVAGDALVARDVASLEELPAGAIVGTGSLRRRSQLLRLRPDLVMKEIRGNVDTRLRKLDEGQYDAIVLAAAGLGRLDLENRITQLLPLDAVLPAPGQGALAIECRKADTEVINAVSRLNDEYSKACVTAERAMLAQVEGGCLAAIGAYAQILVDRLHLAAAIFSEDGTERLFAEGQSRLHEAEQLGRRVGDQLLAQGAGRLVRERS